MTTASKRERVSDGVCVWVPTPHKEMDQNDYCGETRSG